MKVNFSIVILKATGICAQHNNGGLKANIWWESDLKHLFPVGEIEGGGRSRGSYIVTDGVNSSPEGFEGTYYKTEFCRYDRDIEAAIQEARLVNDKVIFTSTAVRDIPEQNLWFEKVWKEYLEDNYTGERDDSTNY